MTKPHIVNFSGGVTSWAAAHRVVEKHGKKDTLLLTANTGSEADDWLSWVEQAAEHLGCELVMVRSEKYDSVIDLAMKRKFLPNPRAGVCSQQLKVLPMVRWLRENAPDDFTQYFGFTWDEIHRLDRMRNKNPERRIEAPLLWEPVMSKREAMLLLSKSGLPVPEAYKLGMEHNNCLSHGCFRQSRSAWKRLLVVKPEAYKKAEDAEQEFRQKVNNTSTIFRQDTKKEKQAGEAITLEEFRKKQESNMSLPGDWDDGACSCFSLEDLEAMVE